MTLRRSIWRIILLLFPVASFSLHFLLFVVHRFCLHLALPFVKERLLLTAEPSSGAIVAVHTRCIFRDVSDVRLFQSNEIKPLFSKGLLSRLSKRSYLMAHKIWA